MLQAVVSAESSPIGRIERCGSGLWPKGRADMGEQHHVFARATASRATFPGEVAARADVENLAQALNGKLFLHRSNPIDFPHWRKSRGPLLDFAFLPQDLVLAPHPLQLGCQAFLPLATWCLQIMLTALVEPAAQRRQTNGKILGDFKMLFLPSEELSSFARQAQLTHRPRQWVAVCKAKAWGHRAACAVATFVVTPLAIWQTPSGRTRVLPSADWCGST
jgi:hypothetical protein